LAAASAARADAALAEQAREDAEAARDEAQSIADNLGDFTDLNDTPADYTGHADKIVRVSPDEDGLVFTEEDDGTSVYAGPTAPANTDLLWYKTAGLGAGDTYHYFTDEDSSQWVPQIVAAPGAQGSTGSTGPQGPQGPQGPAGADGEVYSGATAPGSPTASQLWHKTNEPVGLFTWFNDGTSTQWVQIC
tara:strand:+ start:2744 stop:3313 length:570 start_codon:yes stop_codon:yes gene_type:complete